MQTTDLRRLRDYFHAGDIEWKPITVSKKTSKGLAAAYITNRAIMERLDEVVGPENWRNDFRPGPNGGVVCGLSIRVVREDGTSEWITKWDGADNTDIEAVKGGLSNAMRRAAVQWGIGRYLYDIPSQWVAVDDYGRFTQEPRLPREFLPTEVRPSARPTEATPRGENGPRAEASRREERAPAGDGFDRPARPAR
ncbi:MAG TPA: Rad52/Rad22 family DNA repair protein [Rhodothermales bacterium]|nr:Rad52/Rad22 family DNA repair protein [Rhodothermales bacterium]